MVSLGPACNYQNVDLFKIPEPLNLGLKQHLKKNKKLSEISQIENNVTNSSLLLHDVKTHN
jgi:hypothetical protein